MKTSVTPELPPCDGLLAHRDGTVTMMRAYLGSTVERLIYAAVLAEHSAIAASAQKAALTNEQIFAIHESTNDAESQVLAFARAIEAAAAPNAALVALIQKAQWILAVHLPPDGPDAKTTISELLGLLDGPESRSALAAAGVKVA